MENCHVQRLYCAHAYQPTSYVLRPTSYVLLVLIIGLSSCSKDKEIEPNTLSETSRVGIKDYTQGAQNSIEGVRILLSRALAHAIQADRGFKEYVLAQLIGGTSGVQQEVPVLALLSQEYRGHDVADLLARYYENSSNGELVSRGGLSGSALLQAVYAAEPNMSIELPSYMGGFAAAMSASLDISRFSDFPAVVYGETTLPNSQGYFVGYGESPLNEGVVNYGVVPGGSYDGYIPIHIKRSRQYVVVDRTSMLTSSGIEIASYSGVTPESSLAGGSYDDPRTTECLMSAYERASVAQDFLSESDDLVSLVGYRYYAGESGCSQAPNFDCASNPELCQELCNNGIDDDQDGLVDGADPDCAGIEICNNGIDDDGDGLIDAQDQECISCNDIVNRSYRDCEVGFNTITGAQFKGPNVYSDVLNPTLPSLEPNVNLRFDMFSISNIENCDNCQLKNYERIAPNRSVAVILDEGVIPSSTCYGSPPSDSRGIICQRCPRPIIPCAGDIAVTSWNDDMRAFQNFVDPELNTLNDRAHFIILITNSPTVDSRMPSGAVRIGSIGTGGVTNNRNQGVVANGTQLYAYVVYANWVPIEIAYTSSAADRAWDASRQGSTIEMVITETDAVSSVVTSGNTVQGQQTVTRTVSVDSKFGFKLPGNITGEISPKAGYSFANQKTKSATTSFAVSSERVLDLGSEQMNYASSPNSSAYPIIRNPAFGVSSFASNITPNTSWGYEINPEYVVTRTRANPGASSPGIIPSELFNRNSTGNYQLINLDKIRLINLIRIEE